MKKKVLSLVTVACLLFSLNAQAQGKRVYKTKVAKIHRQEKILNSTVFEAGIGHQLILSPKTGEEGFNKFGAFHLGARMTIKNNFGIRGFFQHNNFAKGSNQGVKMNKIVGEGTYRLRFEGRNTHLSRLSILAHAGAGVGFSKSQVPNITTTEKIGVLQVGFMPEYRFNHIFAIFADFTYTANISQHYLFSGSRFDNTNANKAFTGQLFIPSFGISIKPFK